MIYCFPGLENTTSKENRMVEKGYDEVVLDTFWCAHKSNSSWDFPDSPPHGRRKINSSRGAFISGVHGRGDTRLCDSILSNEIQLSSASTRF